MAEVSKEEISATLIEFFQAAKICEKKGWYKAAITLYYKTLVESVDFLIFEKTGNTPINHRSRFRYLNHHYKKIYQQYSDLFKIYRKTYSRRVSKAEMEKVKQGVRNIITRTNIIDYLKAKIKEFEDIYFE
jgi:uncharacterized protein (UPF0332 family)